MTNTMKYGVIEPAIQVKECPFCGLKKAYTVKERTNIYSREWDKFNEEYMEVEHVEVYVRCHRCGASTCEHAVDYETAKKMALDKWNTRYREAEQ